MQENSVFVKVTAMQCNQQGTTAAQSMPIELQLNSDLIGAIWGNEVMIKGGEIVNLGGKYWTRFRVSSNQR